MKKAREHVEFTINSLENIEALKKQAGRCLSTDVFLTSDGDVFQRAVSFVKRSELNLIKPTTDQGLFDRRFSLDGSDLVGFFCGDPDEWIPVLLRDGYLSSACGTWVAVVDLVFPEGTVCIKHTRSVDFKGHESLIDEFFVVHDKPVKPTKVHVLTQSEMEEYDQLVEEITETEDDGVWL